MFKLFKPFEPFELFTPFAVVTPALEHPTLGTRQAPHPPLSAHWERGAGGEGRSGCGLEPPPRRPVRLDGRHTEDGMEGKAVDIPGRRSRARSAVRSREGLAFHFRRPPALAVQAGYRLQRRFVGDATRLALQDEVDGHLRL